MSTEALLAALAGEPEGVSLPRLCKRLGLRMSVLLRELAWLGPETIGDRAGPDWVRVETRGELNVARLTPQGRAAWERGQPADADGSPHG